MTIEELCAENAWHAVAVRDADAALDEARIVLVLLPEWSEKDFNIIKSLVCRINDFNAKVVVMNIDEVRTQDKLETLVPGFPLVSQSPVIAYIENGRVTRFAQGEDSPAQIRRGF